MSNDDLIDCLREQISAIESGKQAPTSTTSSAGIRKRRREAPATAATPLTDSLLDAGRGESDAFKKVIALVNVSDRSERSLRQRLERDGFSEAAVDSAIARALDYGFIDDARFASVLIRSRLSQGKGVEGIRRELSTHGIDLDDVPGWPYEFEADDEDETQRALAYLEKHPTRSKNKRDGAYRKLMQRGFSSSVASSVARVWSERFA